MIITILVVLVLILTILSIYLITRVVVYKRLAEGSFLYIIDNSDISDISVEWISRVLGNYASNVKDIRIRLYKEGKLWDWKMQRII